MTEQKDAAFKPPKPRVYTGKGPDKDPEKFRQWRSELTDYFHLSKIKPENELLVLQYFVSDIAKNYFTQRRNQTKDNPDTLAEMLDRRAKHCIPSTHGNMYWKQWDKVSQTQNGQTQRIGNVAIEIDRLCECMDISKGSKLQKFLDSMHPELRLQVEPKIDKKQFDWEAVVSSVDHGSNRNSTPRFLGKPPWFLGNNKNTPSTLPAQ